MNIAQLSEQLKDVPQGTLVGYAKNPNSVVPQFLALAEIQRRQHLQAQAPAPTGTVADDVLAQANPVPQQMAPQQMPPQQVDPRMLQAMQQQAQQLPENQPGVAQLPSGMPQGMASGGIVAFAGGGMPDMGEDDEDYQDYLDKRETAKRRSGVDEIYAMLKDRVAGVGESVSSGVKSATEGIRAALPESYEAAKAKVAPNYETAKSMHPYAAVALDEAKKLGVNPNEILHMLHKETGNLKDPSTAVSKAGARGPMQLMPNTAKELGVDINDPEANTRGGVRYYAKMLDMFKGDPVMAMAAYNAGPGRVRQMLQRGHGIESLSQETQGYVKRSEGGITRLAKGGISLDDYYASNYYEDGQGYEPAVVKPQTFSIADYYAGQDAADMSNVMPPTRSQNMSLADYYAGQDTTDAEGAINPLLAAATTPPVNEYDQMLREQRAAIEENKAGKKQDALLALMQAGFGMMGGTSPYAFANIGQGASSGVNAYANLSKQRGAELTALRKMQSGTLEGKQLYEAKKIAQENLTESKKNALESLDYARKERIRQNDEKIANAAEAATAAAEAKRRGLLDGALKNAANDDDYQATTKILKELESMKPDDPKIQYYRDKLEAIRQSYIQTSLKGEYVPPKLPVYTPPVKPSSKGVLQSIKDIFSTNTSSPKAPASSTLRFDTNGNPIQ
jgi:hypothetical protein